jgi:hypothetical protein
MPVQSLPPPAILPVDGTGLSPPSSSPPTRRLPGWPSRQWGAMISAPAARPTPRLREPPSGGDGRQPRGASPGNGPAPRAGAPFKGNCHLAMDHTGRRLYTGRHPQQDTVVTWTFDADKGEASGERHMLRCDNTADPPRLVAVVDEQDLEARHGSTTTTTRSRGSCRCCRRPARRGDRGGRERGASSGSLSGP